MIQLLEQKRELLLNIRVQFAVFMCFLAGAAALYLIGYILLRVHSRNKRRHVEKIYMQSVETIQDLLKQFSRQPTEFESYMAMIFEALGYENVTVTQATNDGGKDLIMYRNGQKCAAEVKLYSPQYKIGREKIQKLHSAMLDTTAERACFVTTSSFTQTAEAYAGKHEIDLIDGPLLGRLIAVVKKGESAEKPDISYISKAIFMDEEESQRRNKRVACRTAAAILAIYLLFCVLSFFTAGIYIEWVYAAVMLAFMTIVLRLMYRLIWGI